MKPIKTIRRVIHNTDTSAKSLNAIREGTTSQVMLNHKMQEQITGISNQSCLLNDKLSHLIGLAEAQLALQHQQNQLFIQMMKTMAGSDKIELPKDILELPDVKSIIIEAVEKGRADYFQRPPQANDVQQTSQEGSTFQEAMAAMPLMIAEKTFNTSHPDYDARAARNFPGKIFNHKVPCSNVVYKELLKMAKGSEVPEKAWQAKLPELLAEAKTVPGSEQVFERKAFIEQYMADLSARYKAHYVPGWVNLNDALFLYWVVRTLKPKTIVQTGVCNGLSSAFMMLALAKNGPDGKLYVIDLPPLFDSTAPEWKKPGYVYGVVIPEGKSSGWIVPDRYRDRFIVQVGDAKEWMPKVVDKVDSIDLFYHDSDHTYNHMMFEFAEAKRKLRPGGVILGDDISWNASVWDFADKYNVPSYNYLGTVGAAFF